MSAVWVVDDDESIRWVLERALSRSGFSVRLFGSAHECLDALSDESPNVIVSDIRMPGRSGLELLERIKGDHPDLPVIVMTAYSDLDSAVSALQGGAFEYLPKPFDLDKAVALIERAVSEATPIDTPDTDPVATGLEILGQAPAMQEVFRAIGRLATSNATVLITGESGTGKELVARALHDHSNRAGKVFIALNTAAIPRDLLESELFGHERGAFTGAQAARPGRFEQAEGGTLFLDEIGDMPAELQTRLLRVLSDNNYYRVGGHQPRKANVRVIAATHQDLEDRVRLGLFREDLFHRLHVIRLRLPPLRERPEDIPLLARHFLQKSARSLGGETKRLSNEALAALAEFNWPGNVRQLENICHWLTVMAPTQQIGVGDLPPELRRPTARVLPVAPPETMAPIQMRSISDDSMPIDEPVRSAYRPAEVPSEAVARAANGTKGGNWLELLEREVSSALDAQTPDERNRGGSELMDKLTRAFETVVIGTALRHTRSRRIDAALRLGIGRNTITRKIKDLKLEDDAD